MGDSNSIFGVRCAYDANGIRWDAVKTIGDEIWAKNGNHERYDG